MAELSENYDLCVIGGGINGAGIARDAAGRGLSVLLVEAQDLASATSSASTKLIHGGLRYLEYYEFGLVRESLQERERLLSMAPHIIWPLNFILPHDEGQRPYWMIRAGLFLYDHLAKRERLHGSKGVSLRNSPLNTKFTKGFRYTDCWVQDARLVVLNAMSAAQKGATVLTYTSCIKLKPEGDQWRVELEGGQTVKARAVINAAGPWVREFLQSSNLDAPAVPHVRLVKGSHIVVKRAHEGEEAYMLQQPDQRIVFVIPYEHEFTLIGTTEENFTDDPREAHISTAEKDYLCTAYNEGFKNKITQDDIIWSYSGVRPLFDDGEGEATAVSRDYRLYHHDELGAPLLSVFGGKLTTYRTLAEEAVSEICEMMGRSTAPWTDQEALPGGDIEDADIELFAEHQAEKYPSLTLDLLCRYVWTYGALMDLFLDGVQSLDDLGVHYGDHIYEAEIKYLVQREWARTLDDILWRRSKLGLHISDQTKQNLEQALPELLEGVVKE